MIEGWQKYKLNELADMCLGKMLDQNKNKGEFLPYLANINVRWGSIDLDNLREMRFEEREFERYGLKYGDIVMCEGGEPGRCAIWKNQISSMMIQKALHRIRAKENIDSFFLYYALLNKGLNGQYSGFFTGAAIKHLTGESLAKIELDIPSLPTQKKIGSLLAAYDDLIENNLKRIKLLEELAQITYEEWFVRFRFPNHESTPINPTTNLPEGWKKTPLYEISNFIFGYPFKAEQFNSEGNGTPIVRIRNIPNSSTGDYTTEVVDKKYIIEKGDLLVGMDGEFYINNWTSKEAYLVQRVCNIKPLDVTLLGFLTEAVKSPIKFYEATISGATVAHLGKKHLDEIEIVIPSKTEMLKIFNDLLSQKIKLSEQNSLLREARDILLPRLMTGLIDVDQYHPENLIKDAA